MKIENVRKAIAVARRLDGRPVMYRIKTVDDVLHDLGEQDSDVIDYRSLLRSFDDDHHLVNHQLTVLITKALNEGWTPDWSNPNECKYFPYFVMRGSSGFRFRGFGFWRSNSLVGSRLCFKTQELAEHAGKQFQDVYEKTLK